MWTVGLMCVDSRTGVWTVGLMCVDSSRTNKAAYSNFSGRPSVDELVLNNNPKGLQSYLYYLVICQPRPRIA